MIIEDPELLSLFRLPGPCEYCGRLCPWGRDPAHIFARGLGGGSQVDIRENIVSLCRVCHTDSHAGNRPLRCDLLALAAAREGVLQADIERVVFDLLRLPKRSESEAALVLCGLRGHPWWQPPGETSRSAKASPTA